MSKVHFILDEAALMGHMDAIDNALGIGRGYGIRLQILFQSMGQLNICYPEAEQTLLSNANQIFFGVNDNATAEYVSTRLGEHTIILESGGTSAGTSSQWTGGNQTSTGGGRSRNQNHNWQQHARKLLKPEEVMALPLRTAISFAPGVPPICTTLIRYYEESMGDATSGYHEVVIDWGALGTWIVLCLLSVVLAARLTFMLISWLYIS